MGGGRTKAKWYNLVNDAFHKNERGIILISETWLVNQEVAPPIEGYYYIGSNREGLSTRQAKEGVGILISENLGEVIWTEKGRNFIAHSMKVSGIEYIIISVYVTHESLKKNMEIFQNLRKLLNKRVKKDTRVIVGGDFNAHISEFAETQNVRGSLLKNLANQNKLTIVNMTTKCRGKATRKEAVLDYVLCNDNALENVLEMEIDEKRTRSTISDHNMINLELRLDKRKRN